MAPCRRIRDHTGLRLLPRDTPGTRNVRLTFVANLVACARGLWAVVVRSGCNGWIDSGGHRPPTSGRCALARGGLDWSSLLVYGIHFVRESGNLNCAISVGHVCRHPTGRRTGIYCRTKRRGAGGTVAGSTAVCATEDWSWCLVRTVFFGVAGLRLTNPACVEQPNRLLRRNSH